MESTFRSHRSTIVVVLLTLTLVFGRSLLIPIPWTHDNVNLCDVGVFIAVMLLGPGAGTIVGGFGGMFLDLISGFPQDAPFPFTAYDLEGLIGGRVCKRYGNATRGKWTAILVGTIVMIAIYSTCNTVTYHVVTGFLSLGPNFVQGVIGGIVVLIVIRQLKKHRAG